MALDMQEKAFVVACIDLKIAADERAARNKGKGG